MKTNSKLREAVVEIIDYLEPIRKWIMPSKENNTKLTALFAAVDTVYTKAKSALVEPVRNCEVGTAEEQAKRMNSYCARYGERIGGSWRCDNCPLCSIDRCDLVWAQMPYEAKEGGDK